MIEAGIKKRPSSDEVTARLMRLIRQMPKDSVIDLLSSLEEKQHTNRRATRIPYCAEVVFCVNERFYTGYIVNINANGIFIETDNAFSLGDKLTLSFQSPGSSGYVKITGKIARVAENGVGVSFDVNIEKHLKGTLLQTLDNNMRKNVLQRNELKAG